MARSQQSICGRSENRGTIPPLGEQVRLLPYHYEDGRAASFLALDVREVRNLMAKEEMLEFEGVVAEVLPDARCRVKLDNGHEVIAYTSGRMKKNRIRILAGDRVTIEMTPYDLTKGRINFRHKDVRAGSGPPPRAGAGSFRRR